MKTVPPTQAPWPSSWVESLSWFADLVDASGEVVNGVHPDGRIAFWSPGAERLYGWTEAEVIGQPLAIIFPPEDRAGIPALLERLASGERVPRARVTRVTKAGRRIPVEITIHPVTDASGRFVGACGLSHDASDQVALETEVQDSRAFQARVTKDASGHDLLVGTIQDITDQRRAQDGLRLSEQRYRLLWDHSPLPKWLTDRETLRIVDANDAMSQHYGYTRDELRAMTIEDLRDPAEVPELHATLMRTRAGVTHLGVRKHRRKDGKSIEVDLTIAALHIEGKLYSLAIANDVTERRQLEQQLARAQRMEAVGQLAGGVAHDFNNLLTPILSYAAMLRDALPDGDPMREDLEEIRKASERAAGLTRQLLAFSRQQLIEPRVLDVNMVIEDLERMLRRLLGEQLEVRARLSKDGGLVLADPGQLEQVIVNLAVNARDAMPDGGTLVIETANVELDESYTRSHTDAKPGRYVMLAVTDTGTGMTAETMAHIFEPFFTTKERGRGTGLGLATVYGIVRRCGGHLAVYSELGRGTTFKIYFPAHAAASGTVAGTVAPAVQGGRGETILLVEDDDGVRRAAQTILRRAGYEVIEASSGAEAFALAEARLGSIDLLLTDVVMPRLSGRDVARHIAREWPDAKVLYMSGYTDNTVLLQTAIEERIPFLQKPFTQDSLTRKVRAVLDGARGG